MTPLETITRTPGAPRIQVAREMPAVAKFVADRLIDALAFRLKDEWVAAAHAVFTGGVMNEEICEALADSIRKREVDWEKVHAWWTDERFFRTGHIGRHDTRAAAAGLLRIGMPERRIHPISGPDRDEGDTPMRAAEEYADLLHKMAPHGREVPVFDVALISVGPDGEIGALYPGHPAVSDQGIMAAIVDAPSGIKQRITMTLPTLNAAARVWFLAYGDEGAAAVSRVFAGGDPREVPAAGVRGRLETLWWLDEKAARGLPPEVRATHLAA